MTGAVANTVTHTATYTVTDSIFNKKIRQVKTRQAIAAPDSRCRDGLAMVLHCRALLCIVVIDALVFYKI
jgi:hypothetical protein